MLGSRLLATTTQMGRSTLGTFWFVASSRFSPIAARMRFEVSLPSDLVLFSVLQTVVVLQTVGGGEGYREEPRKMPFRHPLTRCHRADGCVSAWFCVQKKCEKITYSSPLRPTVIDRLVNRNEC